MAQDSRHSFVPKDGFVPDSETAVQIAEAVLSGVYGREQIAKQKPLKAVLKGDVWVVTGTLPENLVGGTVVVELSKRDARVMRVTHEK
jgi:hypothetical protein